MRIADKGADIVRITVQGKREADACYEIKDTLIQKGWVFFRESMNDILLGSFFSSMNDLLKFYE